MYIEKIKGPKRGVSAFSYSGELAVTMELEDVFKEMYDIGATGIEILANAHIPNYPNPTDEWIEQWFRLCEKYQVVPVEYGHWIESRLSKGETLSTEESYKRLKKDIHLAHRLGFTVMRTKMGVINETLSPVENWQEIIEMALPLAEECNVRMCPEIHIPTALKSDMVKEYVDFIKRTKTKYFGLNIDFGTFQTVFDPNGFQMPGLPEDGSPCSYPEDLIPLLPYVYCCHAKFNYMDENFEETTIPYREILKVFMEHKWDGYLLSEYEGAKKNVPGFVSEQIRRQHVMMKNILGY